MRERIDEGRRGQWIAALVAGAALMGSSSAARGQTAGPPPPPRYAPQQPYAPGPQYAPSGPPYAPQPGAAPPAYYAPVDAGTEAGGGSPRMISPWDPDLEVPEGYRHVSRPNGRLIGAGVALLSSGWVTSMLVASIATDVENDEKNDAADGVTAGDWVPMYIPVAGPFVMMATLDPRPSLRGLLLLDGIVQTAGALGVVLGITVRNHALVRSDTYADVHVVPVVGPTFHGLQATARF